MHQMRFSVGDHVFILDGKSTPDPLRVYFSDSMKKYIGAEAEIRYVNDKSYKLDVDGGYYNWADYWLEEAGSDTSVDDATFFEIFE